MSKTFFIHATVALSILAGGTALAEPKVARTRGGAGFLAIVRQRPVVAFFLINFLLQPEHIAALLQAFQIDQRWLEFKQAMAF